MKSFDAVYKTQKQDIVAEQQIARDKDRAVLVSAMKKEFGVNDFSKLSENERMSYKSMLNEMWTKNEGLTEKGKLFLNEALAPLTDKSTDQQIEKRFKAEIKANLDAIMKCLATGGSCDKVVKIKTSVEQAIGRKLSNKMCKVWVYDVCSKALSDAIKKIAF